MSLAYLIDSEDYLIKYPPVATTAAAAEYPAENLTCLPISKPARLIGFSAIIRADIGATNPVDLIAVVRHNLSSSAAVTALAGDTVECSQYSVDLAWHEKICFVLLPTPVLYRHWMLVIRDESNLDGYIEIGRLMLGKAEIIKHMFYGQQWQRQHILDGQRYEFGVHHYEYVYDAMHMTFPLRNLSPADMSGVVDMIARCKGSLTPCLIIPNTDADQAYYGRWSANPVVDRSIWHSTELEFEEESWGRRILEPQLFSFDAAKNMPGSASFNRDSQASYIDNAACVKYLSYDSMRLLHHELPAVRSLLLEQEMENAITAPEDFGNEAWTKWHSSVVDNCCIAPDLALTADKIVEDAEYSSHPVFQSFGAPNGTDSAFTLFVRAAERKMACVSLRQRSANYHNAFFDMESGAWISVGSGFSNARAQRLANGWYRVALTCNVGTGGEDPIIYILPAITVNGVPTGSYQGDGSSGIYVWGAQMEIGAKSPSSYLPGSRAPEELEFPYNHRPQASTFYLKFIDPGFLDDLWMQLPSIGSFTACGIVFVVYQSCYRFAYYRNAQDHSVVSLSRTSDYGDVVELRGLLYGNGSIAMAVSINGSTEVSSQISEPAPLVQAWDPEILRFGSYQMPLNILSVKHLRGIQPLEVCRRA